MVQIKNSLVFVFLLSFTLFSLSSAMELHQPAESVCYNPFHYNYGTDMGDCERLFDGNTTTGYIWRESNTWVTFSYAVSLQQANLTTVTDQVNDSVQIDASCLFTDEVKINIANLNSFTCWDGEAWIAFGHGLGGWQPNDFYEVYLEFEEGAVNARPNFTDNFPINNSTDQTLSVELSVIVHDADGDLIDINFIGNKQGNATTLLDINLTSLNDGDTAKVTWADLDYNETYEWYVTVKDALNSDQSATWQFSTLEAAPIVVPEVPSSGPSNNPNSGGSSNPISPKVVEEEPELIVEDIPETPVVIEEPEVIVPEQPDDADDGVNFGVFSAITGAVVGLAAVGSYLGYAKYVIYILTGYIVIYALTWRRGRFLRKLLRLFLR
jgi:hypothetical protein